MQNNIARSLSTSDGIHTPLFEESGPLGCGPPQRTGTMYSSVIKPLGQRLFQPQHRICFINLVFSQDHYICNVYMQQYKDTYTQFDLVFLSHPPHTHTLSPTFSLPQTYINVLRT